MYTQQEASRARQEFWTAFGQYMSVVPNADGEKTNWINYKTGNKHVHLNMHADNKQAEICIEISHPDEEAFRGYVDNFTKQKQLLESILNETWLFQPQDINVQAKNIFIISRQLDNANMFNKADWPLLISFFKESITAFDEFWQMARYSI